MGKMDVGKCLSDGDYYIMTSRYLWTSTASSFLIFHSSDNEIAAEISQLEGHVIEVSRPCPYHLLAIHKMTHNS